MSVALIADTLVVAILAATIVWENERHHKERQEVVRQIDGLLQRIQAPEHAVIAKFNSDQPEDKVQAVNEFDDETYWLSREELAERVGEQEVNGNG